MPLAAGAPAPRRLLVGAHQAWTKTPLASLDPPPRPSTHQGFPTPGPFIELGVFPDVSEANEIPLPRSVRQHALKLLEGGGLKSHKRKKRAAVKRRCSRLNSILFLEVFSVPRVSPELQRRGYVCSASIDKLTGVDLLTSGGRRWLWEVLEEDRPQYVALSPPCTALCVSRMSNWSRMRE